MATKKRVVILGGGLAGLPLALSLEKNKKIKKRLDVLLIDKKQYFEMNCESVRFLVQPEIHHKFVAPYSVYLKSTQFLCANIHAVDRQNVVIERDGVGESELIPYDYLIVALGTKYEFFKASKESLPERIEEIEEFAQRLKTANRVLIVGGRTVGVEFLGEIIEKYKKEKELILVHSGKTLLDNWPSPGAELINKFVGKERVTIILGRKVVKSEQNKHYLDDGSIIEADLKIITSGMTPNEEPLRPFFDNALSPNHCLKVFPSLLVEGFDNIFAIGDIVDLQIPKLAANIRKQKKVIERNLEALVFGKEPLCKLKSSKLQEVSLVSIGPSNAIMVVPISKSMVSFVSNSLVSHFKTNMFIRLTKNPSLI